MRGLSRFEKKVVICIGGTAFVVSLLLASGAIVRTYRNTSPAMEPTLRIGETLIVDRTQDTTPGAIIVFRYPKAPQTLYVKRVVAVGGDVVEIRAKQLLVNGRPIAEPYVVHNDVNVFPKRIHLPEPYRSRDHFGPHQIPDAHVFVLGDNRDRSSDSRFWGAVQRDLVIGRVAGTFSWRKGFRKIPSTVVAGQ